MNKIHLFSCLLLLFALACRPPLPPPENEVDDRIVGNWNFSFQYLPDGTPDPDNLPAYSILEFEYSDAFHLKADQFCDVSWHGNVNAEDIPWSFDEERGILKIADFSYTISWTGENSIDFETPKGNRYELIREE